MGHQQFVDAAAHPGDDELDVDLLVAEFLEQVGECTTLVVLGHAIEFVQHYHRPPRVLGHRLAQHLDRIRYRADFTLQVLGRAFHRAAGLEHRGFGRHLASGLVPVETAGVERLVGDVGDDAA